MNDATPNDLAAIRARLEQARGPEYWRSLEELAGTPAFQEALHREFPQGASELTDPVSRRTLLKLMGASLALAGITACTRQPAEKIYPYVRQPEELVPGRPLFFATAMPLDGYGTGLLVESHEGRPTKVEGNPEHPVSRGSTDAFAQASILGLYDPDRSTAITYLGEIRPWGAFLTAAKAAVEARRARGGAGVRLLTGTITSPTLGEQIRALTAEFPELRWHQWDPAGRDQARAGAALAFGEIAETHYQLGQAAVILALDADFLACGPASLRLAREFADGRRLTGGRREMNRLYAVEPSPTLTGSVADHRLPVPATAIHGFALALAAALGVPGLPQPRDASAHAGWIVPLARDLQAHRGRSVVIVGDEQPAAVHAVAHAINEALGNVGTTVVYTDPVEVSPVDQLASLSELAADMEAGLVETLFILGSNPVYTAPADLEFGRRLEKVKQRFHLGQHLDETAALSQWHVPEAHYLESWGDVRAADGTASLIQPLIAPLHGGRTAHEVLGALGQQAGQSAYSIVRAYWQARLAPEGGPAFERQWRRALHDGLIPGTAATARAVKLAVLGDRVAEPAPRQGLEIVFRADPTVHDGRFANNPWLQELPKPHTKLTWDNAALVSPSTAARLGLANEDLVELRYRGRRVEAPVWVVPGQAADSITVHLGYGRERGGRIAAGPGFDAYRLRTTSAPWAERGLEVAQTGRRYRLASAQNQQMIDARPVVRSATLEEFRRQPGFAREMAHEPPRTLTLYPEQEYKGYAWAMTIDLNTCIGCGACVAACNAENNIPVVGKTEVSRGRRMHWLRVDRYYRGDPENPEAFNQPVPCMHCEKAPCEVVCPTAATVHSAEGLNDMVYNRCVGTRYCSNNCPYKVRRFNFLLYQDWNTPTLKMARNPDVTVRSRGVMEKCTYCVQRINQARVEAEKEGRPIRDGEVVTACAAACPTKAIVFGDQNDAASAVAKNKAEPLNYSLLGDLNTRPRTTYLAAVRNVNPEMPGARAGGGDDHHEAGR
ncbi:MAG: TAT-variant-translocated molybdopterin oxidoreductase [Acidobacteria bacterium]|nr:TAT-variant-translocated molybdopterin oxidoreductase [Acidobacteriota bacterium]